MSSKRSSISTTLYCIRSLIPVFCSVIPIFLSPSLSWTYWLASRIYILKTLITFLFPFRKLTSPFDHPKCPSCFIESHKLIATYLLWQCQFKWGSFSCMLNSASRDWKASHSEITLNLTKYLYLTKAPTRIVTTHEGSRTTVQSFCWEYPSNPPALKQESVPFSSFS